MPTAYLGNLSKRVNSTKIFSGGTAHNFIFKSPVSRETPVLIVKASAFPKYNYMRMPVGDETWYYYIDDIISLDGERYEVHAHVDSLATGKADIQNTNAFCTYANNSNWNTLLDDSRIGCDKEDPYANKLIKLNSTGTIDWSASGMIILRALAQTDIANSSVLTYVMTMSQFTNLLAGLSGTLQSDFNGQQDVKEVLQNIAVKLLGAGSWSDNILSCIWVPFSASNYISLTSTSIVRIGAYEISTSCLYSADTVLLKSKNSDYNIPWTNTQNSYNFTRYPKYTSLSLVHPCGVVEINSPSLANQDKIRIVYAADLFSGDYYIIAKTGTVGAPGESALLSEVLGIGQGNLSMSVMSKVGEGFNLGAAIMQAEASIASQSASLIYSKPVTPAKTTTQRTKVMKNAEGKQIGSIEETTEETTTETTSSGIEGNFELSFPKHASVNASCGGGVLPLYGVINSIDDQFYIQMNASIPCVIEHGEYANFCDRYGWPCNRYLSLNGYSGFVQTVGASVISDLPEHIVTTINSYLNSGIYIE